MDSPPAAGAVMPTPERVDFAQAFYIKLGAAGRYEESSIRDGLLRFGWDRQSADDLNAQRWDKIHDELLRLQQQRKQQPDRGVVTRELNALKAIATSTSADVWITFYHSQLWWGRLADTSVETDDISKFRRIMGGWRHTDIHSRLLLANQIPGGLSRVQGFRATICKVRDVTTLTRVLNGEKSPAFRQLLETKTLLITQLANAITQMHWKDFETLVDLVFRQAGWRRVSMLGQMMKFADLELEEPITHDRYQVQVKSEATLADYHEYAHSFAAGGFRKLYFVVHSPTGGLESFTPAANSSVELVRAAELAGLAFDHGLVGWVMAKIR